MFGAGPLGVLVKLQESGDLKVVGARGAAEARGVLVDDRVAAVDGVPVETGTTEAAFAATIQKAPRPVTITFVRNGDFVDVTHLGYTRAHKKPLQRTPTN